MTSLPLFCQCCLSESQQSKDSIDLGLKRLYAIILPEYTLGDGFICNECVFSLKYIELFREEIIRRNKPARWTIRKTLVTSNSSVIPTRQKQTATKFIRRTPNSAITLRKEQQNSVVQERTPTQRFTIFYQQNSSKTEPPTNKVSEPPRKFKKIDATKQPTITLPKGITLKKVPCQAKEISASSRKAQPFPTIKLEPEDSEPSSIVDNSQLQAEVKTENTEQEIECMIASDPMSSKFEDSEAPIPIPDLNNTLADIAQKHQHEQQTGFSNSELKNEPPLIIYSCNECEFKTKCEDIHIRHARYFHAMDVYECADCEKTFTNKEQWKDHRDRKKYSNISCDVPDEYNCDDCDEIFLTKQDLKNHQALKKKSDINCPICNSLFSTMDMLQEHQKITRCYINKPVLLYKGDNYKIKKNNRTFWCQICLLDFPNITNFQYHNYLLHSDLRLECDICGEKLPFIKRRVSAHMLQKHTTEQFQCKICHKKFDQAYHVKRHMVKAHKPGEIDDGLRANPETNFFDCPVCSKAFNTNYNCRRHMKRFHKSKFPPLKKIKKIIKK